MTSDFDIAAKTYDHDFTHSAIGTLQRERVWKFLDKIIGEEADLKILELNCGTGEDARILAKKGHQIVATDISNEMLAIARNKNQGANVQFLQLDLNDLNTRVIDHDFDLIFSNFGGLNCIDKKTLSMLGESLSTILKPGGLLIAVVMPKLCVWEIVYLILKGRFIEAFRRKKGFAEVSVSGKKVKTWYYAPEEFSSTLEKTFIKKSSKPIGLFIPPSYMERFFENRPTLLRSLNRLEKIFANYSWQAKFSDHFFIHYRLK